MNLAQSGVEEKFRLDFKGATEGRYPNGLKFSGSDITSMPVMLDVFNQNHIDRFTSFPKFSRAVYVLEANSDYERVTCEAKYTNFRRFETSARIK